MLGNKQMQRTKDGSNGAAPLICVLAGQLKTAMRVSTYLDGRRANHQDADRQSTGRELIHG
jgi:hypothetical protein